MHGTRGDVRTMGSISAVWRIRFFIVKIMNWIVLVEMTQQKHNKNFFQKLRLIFFSTDLLDLAVWLWKKQIGIINQNICKICVNLTSIMKSSSAQVKFLKMKVDEEIWNFVIEKLFEENESDLNLDSCAFWQTSVRSLYLFILRTTCCYAMMWFIQTVCNFILSIFVG